MSPVSTLQLMAWMVFCFCARLQVSMRSQVSSSWSICLFLSSQVVLASSQLSFCSFSLQISSRCFSLLRVLAKTDSFLDSWKLKASMQYFCSGSISSRYFTSLPAFINLGSESNSSPTKQQREYEAPRSWKALLSSSATLCSMNFCDPITYHPTRMNSSQQFMLFLPFRSLRFSYSTMLAMRVATGVVPTPSGEVSASLYVSSSWRAQSSPKETPTLPGTFLVWQVLMPTRLIGLISISSIQSNNIKSRTLAITHYYITKPYHPKRMILARNAITRIFQWRCFSTTRNYQENFNYDRFFRMMQQAVQVSSAIQIYQNYERTMGSSSKYLGITLRNLIRLIKHNDCATDMEMVGKFISIRMLGLQGIKLEELSSKEISDFLLFSLKYASATRGIMKREFKEWVSALLHHYLLVFDRAESQERLKLVQILTSVITPIADYFPASLQDYLRVILKTYKEETKALVYDNPRFTELIASLNQLPANNSEIGEFLEDISGFILKEGLLTTFECNALAMIFSALSKAKTKAGDKKETRNTSLLLEAIEAYFNDSIMTLSEKDIEDSLPVFIEHSPHSQYVTKYTEIMARSINSLGRACLHPAVIFQSLSYFNKQQMDAVLKIQPAWPGHFLLFLKHYGQNEKIFKLPIKACTKQILSKSLLPQEPLDWLRKNPLKVIQEQKCQLKNE